jgi:hypothetical protein
MDQRPPDRRSQRRLARRLRARKWAYKLQRALFRGIDARANAALQLELRRTLEEHRARLARGEPLPALEDVELRVFSQNGEDGILLYLLALVGWESRRFVEIGIQDGWECNCANLAKHLGWSGRFVEGDPASAALARQHFDWDAGTRNRDIAVLAAYVTRESVDTLLDEGGAAPADLLSIDIDGMDWWIWQAVRCVRPRIVAIEYNAAFGPERAVTVPYQAVFDRWAAHPSGLYYGASLAALERLGREKGFRLVGCDSAGVNAFFVRDDVAPPALLPVPAAQAFRENVLQNRMLPSARQFDAIAHLPLETV